jgi:hypothetical protein
MRTLRTYIIPTRTQAVFPVSLSTFLRSIFINFISCHIAWHAPPPGVDALAAVQSFLGDALFLERLFSDNDRARWSYSEICGGVWCRVLFKIFCRDPRNRNFQTTLYTSR